MGHADGGGGFALAEGGGVDARADDVVAVGGGGESGEGGGQRDFGFGNSPGNDFRGEEARSGGRVGEASREVRWCRNDIILEREAQARRLTIE